MGGPRVLPALGGIDGARVVSRRYHFHAPGVAYVATTIVLFAGAANAQNNLLFWLFGVCTAALAVSGVISGGMLMRVHVERVVPRVAQVGEPVFVRYRVSNGSRLMPLMGLTIEELAPGPAEGWSGRLTPLRAFVSHVPAGATREVVAQAEGVARGRCGLGRFRVWTTFPFGLMKKSVTFEHDASLLVRPRVASVALPPVLAGGVRGRSSRRQARGGEEFHSLREYTTGDSARRIAWRPSARRDEEVVSERSVATAEALRLRLVADGPGPVAEAVASAAAGLALAALKRGIGVGLEGGPARASHTQVLDALALWRPGASADGADERGATVSIGEGPARSPRWVSIEDLGVSPTPVRVEAARLGRMARVSKWLAGLGWGAGR
ncbi:MAG: DUF58 domain-containing protein [Leptolyngbya sp. PLA1]|nr:DUF58 domain-containing protein [Leptolyngbya sp. PLA1]